MRIIHSFKHIISVFLIMLSAHAVQAQAQTSVAPARPKVIFFDVNETLLDLEPMRESVGKALNGQEELLPLWFSTMLHHSLVDTVTNRYHNFGDIGVAALMMVAKTHGIELSEGAAREAIVTPLRSLPPHPDVKAGLQSLKDQGFRLISFTNSSNQGVRTQFENAGLIEYFDDRFSIEDSQSYKPALAAYQWALKEAGVRADEAMMVAAHGWDIAGVKAAGMTGVFVARPGKTTYPLAIPADKEVKTIIELAEWVQTLK